MAQVLANGWACLTECLRGLREDRLPWTRGCKAAYDLTPASLTTQCTGAHPSTPRHLTGRGSMAAAPVDGARSWRGERLCLVKPGRCIGLGTGMTLHLELSGTEQLSLRRAVT